MRTAIREAGGRQKHRGHACFHICCTKTHWIGLIGRLENGQKSGKSHACRLYAFFSCIFYKKFSMQTHRYMLKFCQFDKILTRTRIFAYEQTGVENM